MAPGTSRSRCQAAISVAKSTQLSHSAGATVIVASHELERAGSLADRIVDVVGGRVDPTDPTDSTGPEDDS